MPSILRGSDSAGSRVQETVRQAITPLGGLDVDVICRSDEATLRAYTRKAVEACWTDGYWRWERATRSPIHAGGHYLTVLDKPAGSRAGSEL